MNAFADLIERQAQQRANDGSFVFLDARGRQASALDWVAFAARVRAVAASLLDLGLGGQRVSLLCPWGEEFVVSLWGCLYAGVVPVPTPLETFERSVGRARAIVDLAKPAAAIVTEATVGLAQRIAADVRILRFLDLARHPASAVRAEACGAMALLQFTSGSTSQPRGVALSPGNLLANSQAIIEAYSLTAADVGVSWLPLHHDMGLIGHVVVPVVVGLRSVLMPSLGFLQRPERWLVAIDKYRGTISSAPNFAYEYCFRRARASALEGVDLSSWRVAICGAEPVDAATLEAFAERFAPIGFSRAALRPSYGLAETTLLVSAGGGPEGPRVLDVDAIELNDGVVVAAGGDAGTTRRLVSCGKAAPGFQIAIVDPRSGEELPSATPGEILVRGDSVSVGYFDARSTNPTPSPSGRASNNGIDGWFRTGDVGFVLEGELYVIGRGDDMMQVRGRNVHAAEVEAVVARAHPALTPGACAAFGMREGGTSELIVAAEVPRVGAPFEAVSLAVREALAATLDLIPRDIVLVPSGRLPRTTSGKIRRSACVETYGRGEWQAQSSAAMASEAMAGGSSVA